MASIRRQGDSNEIRECVTTPGGPRQRTLVRFRGVLTPEILDRAALAATRPFDRQKLAAKARALEIPLALSRRDPAARSLLAQLRTGNPIDPTLVTLLRNALEPLPAAPVPPHLIEVTDWVGRPEAARGKALRGLLRVAGRVLRSRGPLRTPEPERFPHFSSRGN